MSDAAPSVALAIPVPSAARAALERNAHVFDIAGRPRATWPMSVESARGLLINSGVRVDAALLDALPALEIVSSMSVGYDNVDPAALRERGILLTNSRGSLDEAVADLTYALVIMGMRRLGGALNWARDGRWMQADAPFGHDLEGATLGIVGFGGIGPKLARRAQASGMRVIYSNRQPREDDDRTGAAYRSFDALLAEADCVVALVPLSPQTRRLFDDAAFAKMKPTAIFVNAARGAIADTAALLRALDAKTIAGAALDVTDPEPIPAGHPLFGRDDVVILPHVGSATFETRARMAMVAAENLIAHLRGTPLLTPVPLG